MAVPIDKDESRHRGVTKADRHALRQLLPAASRADKE
jgi:hypothetical protein